MPWARCSSSATRARVGEGGLADVGVVMRRLSRRRMMVVKKSDGRYVRKDTGMRQGPVHGRERRT